MKALLRHGALVLGALSLVFACSSTETADTANACELHDGVCGEGCCSQPANRYDPARDCVERQQVIGCAAKAASTSECVMFGIVGCFVSPQGTFRTPGFVPGWSGPMTSGTACSEELRTKISAATDCGG